MEVNNKIENTNNPEKKELPRVLELIDKMFDKFDRHIAIKGNSVIVLLRSHLLVEYYLNQLIIIYGGVSGYKKCEEADFFEKIDYIEQLKLILPERCDAIRRLNKIRNKLSHELEYEISESDIDSIGFCLGKGYIAEKFKKEMSSEKLLDYVLRMVVIFAYIPITNKILEDEKIGIEDKI